MIERKIKGDRKRMVERRDLWKWNLALVLKLMFAMKMSFCVDTQNFLRLNASINIAMLVRYIHACVHICFHYHTISILMQHNFL